MTRRTLPAAVAVFVALSLSCGSAPERRADDREELIALLADDASMARVARNLTAVLSADPATEEAVGSLGTVLPGATADVAERREEAPITGPSPWDAALAGAAGCLAVGGALLAVLGLLAFAVPRLVRWSWRRTREILDEGKAAAATNPQAARAVAAAAEVSRRATADAPGEHEAVRGVKRRLEALLASKSLPDRVRRFLEDEVRVAVSGWESAERDLAAVPGLVEASVADARRRLGGGISTLVAGGAASGGIGTERSLPDDPMRAAELGWGAALEEVQDLLEGAEAGAARFWHLYRAVIELLRVFPSNDPRWEEIPELHALLVATRELVESGPPPSFSAQGSTRASSRYAEASAEHVKSLRQALENSVAYIRMTTPGNPELQKAKRNVLTHGELVLETSRRFEGSVKPFVRGPRPVDDPEGAR